MISAVAVLGAVVVFLIIAAVCKYREDSRRADEKIAEHKRRLVADIAKMDSLERQLNATHNPYYSRGGLIAMTTTAKIEDGAVTATNPALPEPQAYRFSDHVPFVEHRVLPNGDWAFRVPNDEGWYISSGGLSNNYRRIDPCPNCGELYTEKCDAHFCDPLTRAQHLITAAWRQREQQCTPDYSEST